MIPLSDDNPTLRVPIVTYLLLGVIGATWFFVQGAGLNPMALAASVCNLGLVPGELTGLSPVGVAVPLGDGLACVVDTEPINRLTPLTSMFLFILIRIIPLPAWVVLLWWFLLQLITGLPQLNQLEPQGGVAVWAHVGGFVAGLVLVKLFENRALTDERSRWRHRLHPDHP